MKNHPDVQQPWQSWSEEATLHVACAYSNPLRWRTRRLLMNDFRQHMESSPNVRLHVGELAYGERPFEVTGDAAGDVRLVGAVRRGFDNVRLHSDNVQLHSDGVQPHPGDVQLRTSHELWHKENILNVVIQRFPADWQYGAVIDADFHMTRRDWALEAIHQLQHFDFVQLFNTYSDLSAQYRPYHVTAGFASNYVNQGRDRESAVIQPQSPYGGCGSGARTLQPKGPGATGGAWAFRRSAFDMVGGLLDVCILGSADWHMAFGLVGVATTAPELTKCTAQYISAVKRWQDRAAALKGNVGYVENHAIHNFHGSKVLRAYGDRWKILRDHDFNPETDLARDWQGIWQLRGNKPGLRDAIRGYFRARNEDDPGLRGMEREMG